MNKELMLKELEKLGKSSQGEALEQRFKELIRKLKDGSNYNKENFEVDGLACIKAAEKLEKILRELKIQEKPKKIREQNQYI